MMRFASFAAMWHSSPKASASYPFQQARERPRKRAGGSSGSEITMKYFVIKQENVDPAIFVEFWASKYRYDAGSYKYEEIDKRPLKPDSIRRLFAWKAMQLNRKSIMAGEHPFVETVIDNFDCFNRLALNTSEDADNFLTNELKGKGMIWKIFTLHIMYPNRFPVFDQNVYRAMHYVQNGIIEEIPHKNIDKQAAYINEYVPFYTELEELGDCKGRKLDKALFSFGQFLKLTERMGSEDYRVAEEGV